jgi:hypothetical protein
MQALGDERSPGSSVSLERFAQCQSQTSADVMMSHVSSRIESQGGQSRFATGVKVPMKLVHIPLHNRRSHVSRSRATIKPAMRPQSFQGKGFRAGIAELHGEDGATSSN